MRRKRSQVWLASKERIAEIFNNSASVSDALSKFGLDNIGANYKTLKARLMRDGLDYNLLANRGRAIQRNSVSRLSVAAPLRSVMVKCSTYSRSALKARIIKSGLLKNECSICAMKPEWNGLPLSMILDHINGVGDDNRIENLRLVCHNCNSQLSTFAGRNVKTHKRYCIECGSMVKTKNLICTKCSHIKRRKAIRPSKDELEKIIWQKPTISIAADYGVSDKAVDKWCKSLGVSKPGRGYWTKSIPS